MSDVNNEDQEKKSRQSILQENFANKLANMIVNDLSDTNRTVLLKNFSKEKVRKFFQNPKNHEKQLRQISRFLFHASPHYKRLIWYLSQMLTFDYILEPSKVLLDDNVEKLKSEYKKTAHKLDNMNFKHEFRKVLESAFQDDVFYGYEHENQNSYFIQKLDPDYCKITSIEDGVYNFSFNMSYFKSHKNKINKYPDEFKRLYANYLSTNEQWQELSSEKTICIKINESDFTVIPPLSTVFEDIYDIIDYKELKKAREEIGNYKVLVQEIPVRENSDDNDDFALDFDTVMRFHNMASKSLPDGVGMITSPMPINEITFNKDKSNIDAVQQSERDFWNSAGVSQFLFNSDKSSSVGLNKSILTDEQLAFSVLRQLERWVNRKIKKKDISKKFKATFLESTYFNREEIFERYLKASQFGVPVKSRLAASLGISPSSMLSMATLENDILEFHENWIPLSSAHTQSSDETDEGGRPTSNDDDIEETGIKTRDGEGNENRE